MRDTVGGMDTELHHTAIITLDAIRDYAEDAAHSIEQIIESATQLRGKVSVAGTSEQLGVPHATAQRLLAGRTPSHETLRRIADHPGPS